MSGVIVTWADDESANLGVRALAAGTAALAAQPRERVAFENFGAATAGYLSSKDLILGRLGRKPRLAAEISHYRALIDTCGGDSFTDIYGLPRLQRIAFVHEAARAAGVPVILGPQTIGPFETHIGRRIARQVLRRADLIFVRDSTSLAISQEIAPNSEAIPTTDVVFELPVPENVPTPRRDVLFNVSGLLWQQNSHTDSSRYRDEVVASIRELQSQGREVALLAHVLDNSTPDSDTSAVKEAANIVDPDIEIILPTGLADARATIAGARLVIGSRMHACLNALSLGIPAFPWAYSRKFLPLMRDLGWQHGVDLRTDASPSGETVRFITSAAGEYARDQARAVRDLAQERLLPARARISEIIQSGS